MIETSEMKFDDRVVTPEVTRDDNDIEVSLRPKSLSEYIGQDKAKENLAVYIEAARRRANRCGIFKCSSFTS